jgi:hypothetical protein
MDILIKINDNNDIDKYTENHKDIFSVTSLYLFIVGIIGFVSENFYTKWCGVYIMYVGAISTIFWDNLEKGGTLHIIDKLISVVYLLQFLIVNAIYGYKFLTFTRTIIYFMVLAAFLNYPTIY